MIYCLKRNKLYSKTQLCLNRWKKTYHTNSNHKKAVVIMMSDKIDFKIRNIAREKKSYFMIIKGSIGQEDITTTVNI